MSEGILLVPWRSLILSVNTNLMDPRGLSRGDGPLVAQMTEVIVEGELGGEESW